MFKSVMSMSNIFKVAHKDTSFECEISIVYGLNTVEERKALWNSLHTMTSSISLPWILCGDFNSIMRADERTGGTDVSEAEMMDFKVFINTNFISEMKTFGSFYTWTNRHVCSRIDHVLCNDLCLNNYGYIAAEVREPGLSDHHSIFIQIDPNADHNNFVPIIHEAWGENVTSTPMFILWKKLQACKNPLKQLSCEHFGKVDKYIMDARIALESVQKDLATDFSNPGLIQIEKKVFGGYEEMA